MITKTIIFLFQAISILLCLIGAILFMFLGLEAMLINQDNIAGLTYLLCEIALIFGACYLPYQFNKVVR